MEKVITTEIKVTPEEMADVFSEWDSERQALFLNRCGKNFDAFGDEDGRRGVFDGEMQCCYIVDDSMLDENGRRFAENIAGFAVLSTFSRSFWPDLKRAFADRILDTIE